MSYLELIKLHQISIAWDLKGHCVATMTDGTQTIYVERPTLEEAVERVMHIMRTKQ